MHQSNDAHQSPGLDFLIEEYKNLSQAFFQLHAAQLRSFQFFLAFNAVPLVAVWGNVSRWSASIGVSSLPSYCYWLLLLFGFINLVFALHIASLRIEQYRYARAVNQARRAFTDAAPTIAQYLYLPTTRTVPVYHRLGSTTLLTFLIVVIAAIYTTLGIAGLWHLEPGLAPWASAGLFLGVLILCITLYQWGLMYRISREEQDIPDSERTSRWRWFPIVGLMGGSKQAPDSA